MKKIKVSDYIIQELANLGIKNIFGVPGDYNFNIIDSVENNPKVKWIGSTNELNGGYAADGYARLNGYGAVVTTYGVGELSAINAIAGCFAENIPVVMLVGIPSTKHIEQKSIIHHNFAPPDYCNFAEMYSKVTAKATYITKDSNIKEEIDSCIKTLISTKKPVYIAIPKDICNWEIDNNPLQHINTSSQDALIEAGNKILEFIETSSNPIIITDSLIKRFNAEYEAERFINKSNIQFCSFLMGKGIIDESHKNYLGTFLGKTLSKDILDSLNISDCVISIGTIYCDFNTFNAPLDFNPDNMINIQGNYVIIKNQKFENVFMKDLLKYLSDSIKKQKSRKTPQIQGYKPSSITKIENLNSKYLYPRIQEFLKPNDIFICDTGIALFGTAPMKFPDKFRFENQFFWASIGWGTPAALGISLAKTYRRTILLTGEGAHQLTMQEISNIIAHNLHPVIIVINNSGYTIERMLSKNPKDDYNNINEWDYSKLPSIFGKNVFAGQAKTNKEFDDLLKLAETEQKTKMCYIEVFTDKLDIPEFAKIKFKK